MLVLAVVIASAANTAFAQLIRSVETAGMTVSDADRSIAFFNKVLAFEKVSDIEVQGADYEKLQGLLALRMRVVRMKLGDEMIELTQYLAPPQDTRANDIWHWQTTLATADAAKAEQTLRDKMFRVISAGVAVLPEKELGFTKGFLGRDPDGHGLQVIDRMVLAPAAIQRAAHRYAAP